MPLTLYVDGARWRTHLQQVRDAHPGIVPVLKGNGYGFGIERLASRAAWLGVDTVAVGTYGEVGTAASAFCGPSGGSVMVLSPWRPFETRAVFERRVVHTIGRLDDLREVAQRAREGAEGDGRVTGRASSWSASPRCAGTASPLVGCARPRR